MKLYKPLFSIITITLQLLFSLNDYFELQQWKKDNPKIDSLINLIIQYDTLFVLVLITGVNEMFTKPSWLKYALRILLVVIILGYEFSGLVPIDEFRFGVYYAAWFLAIVSVILFLYRIQKNVLK